MTGFFIFDKPPGITSFKAVGIVRRAMGEKKAGHSGTLDPMATGVLTIALGHATRFIDLLPSHDKGYTATFRTGLTTDTLDITGTVLSQTDLLPSPDEVKAALDGFRGEITQLPPMYSAVKVNGKRLYELARRGLEAQRNQRTVTISSLELTAAQDNEYTIEVLCSKGTYIRSLVGDLGQALGCGATLTALRRTLANGFPLSSAYTEAELAAEENPQSLLIPVDKAFESYPEIIVSQNQAIRFKNGGELDGARLGAQLQKGIYRVYSPEKSFLGLGHFNDGNLNVKRVFVND